jgi:UDP-N-acetylmuramoylalanine--D-glutamate ligase
VILNVTPDHLDRHGTMEQYAGVKERLVQGPGQAVIAGDDPYTRAMIKRLRAAQEREVIEVSTTAPLKDGVYEQNEILYEAEEGAVQIIGGLSGLPALMGVHNAQNAACAFAATEAFGCGREEIYSALRSFPGLQHRQFLTRTINGVAYVNDSKATNAAAAAVALGCWENIYWIVGGRKKKNGLDGLEAFFPRIREAFIIGETTDEFAAWFERYGVVHIKCYTMDAAVLAAHRGAQAHRGQPGGGAVVLLSPACASLDQFTSFEQRGQVFESLVQALSEA